MIIYRKGDVVNAFYLGQVDVLVHQCNARGIMGSGIAKQIKDSFPAAFDDYKQRHTTQGNHLELGQNVITTIERQLEQCNGLIVNLIGQNNFLPRGQKHTSYDAIHDGLTNLKEHLEDYHKVAMPKIGAGLGGGDWKVIEAIINSVFQDRDVFVYELE